MFVQGVVKGNWLHLCVDMQRVFAEDTPWHVAWMERIVPDVETVVRLDPARTVFTCFLPPSSPEEAPGEWKAYYRKWPEMTLGRLDPESLGVIPPLSRYVPPARIFRKTVYSPWTCGRLHPVLAAGKVETLLVTGAETDVCVLATVLGAIDLGYRVIVVREAICSGSDRTHDAALEIFANRFSAQLRIAGLDEILA